MTRSPTLAPYKRAPAALTWMVDVLDRSGEGVLAVDCRTRSVDLGSNA
jgi:hypothetical protein